MILTLCFATAYIVTLPVVPVFAVALTLGIVASYLIERAKSGR